MNNALRELLDAKKLIIDTLEQKQNEALVKRFRMQADINYAKTQLRSEYDALAAFEFENVDEEQIRQLARQGKEVLADFVRKHGPGDAIDLCAWLTNAAGEIIYR